MPSAAFASPWTTSPIFASSRANSPDRGFRFIKAPAALLLNRAGAASTDIHPADLSDLLGRFGIDLIAERIESENIVVDLLDYDVRFGQGFLFAPPRPVRAEALQIATVRTRAGKDSGQDPTLPSAEQAKRALGQLLAAAASHSRCRRARHAGATHPRRRRRASDLSPHRHCEERSVEAII